MRGFVANFINKRKSQKFGEAKSKLSIKVDYIFNSNLETLQRRESN